jgi:calcineurin-like phosphoesterase family protein
MSRFWTGDDHFFHTNILGYADRPWPTVEAMNEGLIENWNATVSPEDETIVVGDVVMGHAIESLKLIPRLNGRKRLMAGNHDRFWCGHKPGSAERWRPLYEDAGFEILSDGTHIDTMLGDHLVRVSHFPYESDDRHGDRYDGHYPPDSGSWLIHGHVHTAWKVRGRQINVGVDVWDYTPVSDDRLIQLIESTELQV